jgi:hypothetical protein
MLKKVRFKTTILGDLPPYSEVDAYLIHEYSDKGILYIPATGKDNHVVDCIMLADKQEISGVWKESTTYLNLTNDSEFFKWLQKQITHGMNKPDESNLLKFLRTSRSGQNNCINGKIILDK